MKYIKSFKFWLMFSIILYTFIGFIGIPWFIIHKAPQIAKDKIGLNIDIKKAKFNPYTFELTLENILIKDLSLQPAIEFKKIYLNYNSLRLLNKTLYFTKLQINSPKFYAKMEKNGQINLDNIIPKSKKQKKEKTKSTSSIEIVLQKLDIKNGSIAFTDNRRDKPFYLNLGPYSFKAHDISTKQGAINAHSFSTKLKSGGEIFWKGGMSLRPFKLYGEVNIKNLQLPKLYSYALPTLNAKLQKGQLSLRLPYHVDLTKELKANINNATLTLSNMQISNKIEDNKIISIPKFKISDFNLKWPEQEIKIVKISLDDASVLSILEKNGDINLAKAFSNNEKKKNNKTVTNNAKPWKFLIQNANINRANISFSNKNFKNTLSNKLKSTSLHVGNISSDLTMPILYNFSTILNKNTKLTAQGNIKQNNKIINSDIKLSNLHVKEFLAYIKPYINFKIKNADISSQTKLSINYGKKFNIKAQASTSISNLFINSKKDEKLLNWDNLNIKGFELNLAKQNIQIANLNLNGANIYASLNKNKKVNLLQAFTKKQSNSSEQKNIQSTPWTFLLKDANINKSNISFTDYTLKKPITNKIQKISLHVRDISSDKNNPIDYSLSSIINKNTQLKASGNVLQNKSILNSNIKLSKLHVTDFIRYIKPFINFQIKNADVNADVKIKLYIQKKFNAKVQLDTSINNLALNTNNNKNLINWEKLDIKGINYTYNPMNISIEKLTLNKPYIRLAIAKDHSTNFSNLIKKIKSSEQTVKKQSSTDPLKLKIGSIKLIGGTTEFSDQSLPFPFKTNIHSLNGDISTLNFAKTTPSLIELTGKIDKYGYTQIKGKLIPINIEKNSNINVLFKNIDLSSLTPYSGKFVGYKIKSGKLSMDLKYNINKASLIGDNKINIDTLILGDTIDSPDATNLPLELAVALLKDSNNQIDIDLPVKGDMNNPDFSYGSIVWGAIGHMITGIVTAPFKFLGSMLGVDGDALKSIDFDKGSAVIISTEHEKLKNLQKILEKRPKIKIKLIGGYNVKVDTKELQIQKFIKQIKNKLAKLKTNKKVQKTDNYGIVLKDLYTKKFTETKYKELKNSFMLVKKTDDNKTKSTKKVKKELDILAFNEKMQNELIMTIKIPQKRLISLANNRAKEIQKELYTTYKIDISRITLLPSKPQDAKNDRWVGVQIEISI